MKFLHQIVLSLILLFVPVMACANIIPDTIYAVTPSHLSAGNMKIGETIPLYVLKTGEMTNDLNLSRGDKIEIKVKDYVKPKRCKRNGYYKVEYLGNEAMEGSMKPSTPKDLKEIAEVAGVSILGKILNVPGFSQAFAVSKGLINPNENQSRFESAGKNLYESTPLTYVEKGNDFNVAEDGIVVIRLKAEN